jgi:hypothetical protein
MILCSAVVYGGIRVDRSFLVKRIANETHARWVVEGRSHGLNERVCRLWGKEGGNVL